MYFMNYALHVLCFRVEGDLPVLNNILTVSIFFLTVQINFKLKLHKVGAEVIIFNDGLRKINIFSLK